jgi:mycothiol system anti-sigma-R factor
MGDIRCEEVLAEIERYIDGELAVERLRVLAVHLDECSPCLDRADFQAKLKEIVRRKCSASPQPAPEHLILRVRSVIQAERGPGLSDG